MRGALVATLLFLAGCDQLFGLHHFNEADDSAGDDGGVDGAPRDGDADALSMSTNCFGTGRGFQPAFCFTPAEVAAFPPKLSLAAIVDTQSCSNAIAQAGGPGACVYPAIDIIIGSTIRFVGPRAVVLLATDTITVGAVLDVASSSLNTVAGAGGNPNGCILAPLAGGPGTTSNGGGGGAGGSFVGQGGAGGQGSPNGMGISAGGGTSLQGAAPMVIRGGCRGGTGGAGLASGRPGGSGGGAIYLVAGTSVTVNAAIGAYGAGGDGGPVSYVGGAGGGAGGMIVLDAPTVTLTSNGSLDARGGTGGEGGASNGSGATGADGAHSPPTDTGTGGNGGTGGTASGSPGGIGAPGGGGGGGGGGGYIGVFSPNPALLGSRLPPADIH